MDDDATPSPIHNEAGPSRRSGEANFCRRYGEAGPSRAPAASERVLQPRGLGEVRPSRTPVAPVRSVSPRCGAEVAPLPSVRSPGPRRALPGPVPPLRLPDGVGTIAMAAARDSDGPGTSSEDCDAGRKESDNQRRGRDGRDDPPA